MIKGDLIQDLQCPHCGYRGDDCDFPDLYCEFEYQEQYTLLKRLQDLGYKLAICGMCGNVIITAKQE